MSGIINKIRQMISPEQADKAADQMEKHVTDERVDQAASRVPGGEKLANKVPDNPGEKMADTTREHFGEQGEQGEQSSQGEQTTDKKQQ